MAEQNDLKGLQDKAQAANVTDLPAEKILTKKDLLVIREGSKIFSAIQALETHGVSGAPVVDLQNKLVGVITGYDLLMQAATQDIKDPIVYNKNPIFFKPETPLKEMIILFYKKKLKFAPVVDNQMKIVGIVHRIDILSTLIRQGR